MMKLIITSTRQQVTSPKEKKKACNPWKGACLLGVAYNQCNLANNLSEGHRCVRLQESDPLRPTVARRNETQSHYCSAMWHFLFLILAGDSALCTFFSRTDLWLYYELRYRPLWKGVWQNPSVLTLPHYQNSGLAHALCTEQSLRVSRWADGAATLFADTLLQMRGRVHVGWLASVFGGQSVCSCVRRVCSVDAGLCVRADICFCVCNPRVSMHICASVSLHECTGTRASSVSRRFFCSSPFFNSWRTLWTKIHMYITFRFMGAHWERSSSLLLENKAFMQLD